MSDNKQIEISEIATGLVKLITTDNYDVAYMASSIIAEVATINNQLAMEVISQLVPLLKDDSRFTRHSTVQTIKAIFEENPAIMDTILIENVLEELKLLIEDDVKDVAMAASSAITEVIRKRILCE